MTERVERKGRHSVNIKAEEIFSEANFLLKGIDENISIESKNDNKLVFLCFAPRSGSTLLAEVLVKTKNFSFISNFVARFWESPVFAAYLEKELNLRDSRFFSLSGFESNFGNTGSHFLSHEFGFFWNKMLTDVECHSIDESKLSNKSIENLTRTISQIKGMYDSPFFIKNGIAGLNTDLMKKLFPGSYFLVLERDIKDVARSIYRARYQLYENYEKWWSLKPNGILKILGFNEMKPIEQIVYQIRETYKEIWTGLEGCDNVKTVSYEKICLEPKSTVDEIFSFLNYKPIEGWDEYIPDKLPVRKDMLLDEYLELELENAINSIF